MAAGLELYTTMRLHRRIVERGQRMPQLRHVDDARLAPQRLLLQIGALQPGAIQVERLRGGKLQAAADLLPRAGERRQQRDGAHRHGAALAALHAVVQPDRRGPRGGVFARQRDDLFRGDAGQLRRALRGPLLHAFAQPVEALGVALDVIGIVQASRR